MRKTTIRAMFALLAAGWAVTLFVAQAHAQSSLGIGTNEAVLPSTGLFAGLLNWVNVHQQQFYRALTGALRSMRDGSGGQWLLVALSFAYGVFHAAGPGHGKAVISSYMLANEVALRRGVILSFISAILQGLTAITVMTVVYFLLRGTSVSMTDATYFLEIASYVMVTAFGLWLLWQKAVPRLAGALGLRRAHSLSAAAIHPHDHDHAGHHHHDHHHADGTCASCGHSHAPDPALLAAPDFNWRSAWAAVASVGLRPCTGALIVLSFAFLNGLWVAGVVSVLAMAVGTALTVSLLAVLAVSAKNVAVGFAGGGRMGNAIHAAIEIGGAALVFLIGVTLLAASI